MSSAVKNGRPKPGRRAGLASSLPADRRGSGACSAVPRVLGRGSACLRRDFRVIQWVPCPGTPLHLRAQLPIRTLVAVGSRPASRTQVVRKHLHTVRVDEATVGNLAARR